ncbi:cytochrome c1 [Legionella fallonii]|nr:cytochrome c1 [Legionella fallonii]
MQNVSATEMSMPSISIDIQDKDRLQRGAKLFMNYCSGCHSLRYMRYNRMAEDLGLIDFSGQMNENLLNNLIFTKAAIYDPIQIAMPMDDAQQWFGVIPPDLSLSAREKGANWLYHYLKSFYNDASRPFGVNNLLVPNVAMPNILESLMGQQILVKDSETHRDSLLLVKQGEMLPIDFDSSLRDLVTFLVYVSEPARLIRYRIGVFVVLFLIFFFIVVYCLNQIYWRQLKNK